MIRSNGKGSATRKRRLAGGSLAASLAGLVFAGLSMQSAAAAETRSYVVSWFHIANFLGGPEDCPNGLNPMSTEFYRTDLIALGKTPAEADELLKNFPGGPGGPDGEYIKLIMNRGDHGKTNAFAHPETVEDPHLKTVEGHFAYGFNLDGKGAASPNSFEDPETHEKGVNNQYWRAVGCVRSFRAAEPTRPTYAAANWDILRDQMPAWLISISGITDPRNSDNVTVTFDRALEHVTRDANGDVRPDMTYRVDSNPRSHNVLHGKIKDGVLTIEPGDLHMTADPFLQPDYNFHQAHLRLELKPDGGVKGHPRRLSRLVSDLLELCRRGLDRRAQHVAGTAGSLLCAEAAGRRLPGSEDGGEYGHFRGLYGRSGSGLPRAAGRHDRPQNRGRALRRPPNGATARG